MAQLVKSNTKTLFIIFSTALLVLLAVTWISKTQLVDFFSKNTPTQQPINRENITTAISQNIHKNDFPRKMNFMVGNKPTDTIIEYSFDAKLQQNMEKLFEQYHPDFGAFVAIDSKTGRVLAMVSFTDQDNSYGNLATKATFPAASVFKVITAAAAIEGEKYSSESKIPFSGRYHTLYRRQVLDQRVNRWTRYMTLREAFGKSVNTVFAKLGAFIIEPEALRSFAFRFGFNRAIGSDIPIEESKTDIPNDQWGLAEIASGFTRKTMMSPLQGALIAATIANNGIMMEPYIVNAVYTLNGDPLYKAEPKISAPVMSPETADELQKLMLETITHGTSRSAFRKFFHDSFKNLTIGGKTGSLSGTDPEGKHDWFIGFAKNGTKDISIAALTVHKRLWKVRSSYLARRAIENYFKDN